MRRVLLLAALLSALYTPAWPHQDLSSSAGEFINRPQNPPARRPRERTEKRQRLRAAGRAREKAASPPTDNGGTDVAAADGAVAATPEELMEDALWLANEARDSTPPRYEEAERAYRLAAKLAPKDPRPHVGLGNIFYDQKKYYEAATGYQKAAQFAGLYEAGVRKRVGARQMEGLVRGSNGRSRERRTTTAALSDEERFLITSFTMLGQENAYLGAALMQQGKHAEAEVALKKATVRNSENAEWWALLGTTQLAQHKYAAARRSLRSAVFLEPDNERYATLLSRTGRGTKASPAKQ